MMWVKAKVWFCDPVTCAASSGVSRRAPRRLRTLWLGCWFGFDIVFLLPLASGNKVSESRERKANAIECCSKKEFPLWEERNYRGFARMIADQEYKNLNRQKSTA